MGTCSSSASIVPVPVQEEKNTKTIKEFEETMAKALEPHWKSSIAGDSFQPPREDYEWILDEFSGLLKSLRKDEDEFRGVIMSLSQGAELKREAFVLREIEDSYSKWDKNIATQIWTFLKWNTTSLFSSSGNPLGITFEYHSWLTFNNVCHQYTSFRLSGAVTSQSHHQTLSNNDIFDRVWVLPMHQIILGIDNYSATIIWMLFKRNFSVCDRWSLTLHPNSVDLKDSMGAKFHDWMKLYVPLEYHVKCIDD